MDPILIPLFEKAMSKIGPLKEFVPMLAKSLKRAIEAEDVAAVERICDEIDEAAAALIGVSAHVRLSVSDGTVDLFETSTAFLKMERFVDELEDCFKGYDEDDAPQDTETPSDPEPEG